MIQIFKWLCIVYKGVPLDMPMTWYRELMPTKRMFRFYGIQIKWVLVGITVVAKDKVQP